MSLSQVLVTLLFLHTPAVFGQATTPQPGSSNCTASLITDLCDYPPPESGTAVASDGRSSCWDYCNDNQPCDFVIFVHGNPNTGSGTCWVYPGQKYDPSLGKKDGCDNPYLSVYDKPVCASPATPTTGGCAATASPSAVASGCGYPTPDDNCWSSCAASSGAVHCSSMCVEAEECNYAVFNPRTESLSPYHDGTCWLYANGTYDASLLKSCSGAPEQYVYNNVCPKPPPKPSSSSMSPSSSPTTTSATAQSSNGTLNALNQNGNGKVSGVPTGDATRAGYSFAQPLLVVGAGLIISQIF